MKCSNCSSDSIYVLDHERVSTIYYCGRCLPAHLRTAASKGHLNIPTAPSSPVESVEVEEAPEEEEIEAEEPVVEEEVTEEEPVSEDAEDLED